MVKTSGAKLAIEGGPKAFPKMGGKVGRKIDMREFMSVAERFALKPAALKRLRAAVSNDDFLGDGPNFARYITSFPVPPKGDQFEALARKKFGVKHALCVSSGTGALHAAFVAVGVGPGTEVICPAIGFAATSGAVALAGGVPVFCDVDESLQMAPGKIEPAITKRTVAIAPTHHWGGVCDMAPILRIARRHGLKVVEDCAQGPGATYRGRHVGTIGDVGCFSISAYKIIGGGEGGMVVTNNRRLFDRVCQLAEFGGLWRPDRFAGPRYKGELFVGSNYRMSDLEAAVDLVQLQKLDGIVARHRAASARIRRQLKTFREIVPQKHNDPRGEIGYLLRFYPATFELSRKIAAALRAEGIADAWTRGKDHAPDWHLYIGMFPVILKTGHIPGGSVFDDPRYKARGGRMAYRRGDCPVAEDLYAREVVIQVNQWFSGADCDNVAKAINKVLSAYCTEAPGTNKWF